MSEIRWPEFIKKIRNDLKISQPKLGALLGMSLESVKNWEYNGITIFRVYGVVVLRAPKGFAIAITIAGMETLIQLMARCHQVILIYSSSDSSTATTTVFL